MRKKLFTLFLAIACVGNIFAWDYERVLIGDLYYNLDATSKTAEVTSQNSDYPYWITTITTADIPASVTYNSVPYSVTGIGTAAFAFCVITSTTIPNTVISIENDAFYMCNVLTSVTIPNSVTSIGNHTFQGCSGLTDITIPNSVTSIGNGAFQDCSKLTSITIPNSVTSIGNSAFQNCSTLTSITIPNSVTSIGNGAFQDCSKLTSITIPNSVTSLGNSAFQNCSTLTSITIPNSVTSIGNYTFQGCSGLTSITIPSGVKSIGKFAFFGCTGLTSVIIGNSVTSIGNYAFSHCESLASIVVANGNPVYDSHNNCNAIIETATNTLIAGCMTTIIPNGVTSIGWCAFFGCTGLTTITIPGGVTSIEVGAFSDCTGLTSITCEAINPPTCGEGAFSGVDKSIPLYVPAVSINAYKTTAEWEDFKDNTYPIPSTALNQTTNHKPQIANRKLIKNGQLFIQHNNQLFNTQGARVK